MKKQITNSILPIQLRSVPKSDGIPVLDPNIVRLLTKILLSNYAIAGVLGLVAIAVIGLVFKPNATVAVLPDGTPVATRPLRDDELLKTEQIRKFLEQRIPVFYTWIGVRRDDSDPTGLRFIKDDAVSVSEYNAEKKETVTVGKIPTSVYNEQFALAEPIRNSTLVGIAKLIQKTRGIIWQTSELNPALGVSYRFAFRTRPSEPVEVSPGRWKCVVIGDIVRVSPSLGLVPTEKKIQTFAYEIYVVEAAKSAPSFSQDKTDLVAHGRSSGYVIDAFVPFEPSKEVIESPK